MTETGITKEERKLRKKIIKQSTNHLYGYGSRRNPQGVRFDHASMHEHWETMLTGGALYQWTNAYIDPRTHGKEDEYLARAIALGLQAIREELRQVTHPSWVVAIGTAVPVFWNAVFDYLKAVEKPYIEGVTAARWEGEPASTVDLTDRDLNRLRRGSKVRVLDGHLVWTKNRNGRWDSALGQLSAFNLAANYRLVLVEELVLESDVPAQPKRQSINEIVAALPVVNPHPRSGQVVYLPRTGLVVVLLERRRTSFDAQVLAGNKTYTPQGYQIVVWIDEAKTGKVIGEEAFRMLLEQI